MFYSCSSQTSEEVRSEPESEPEKNNIEEYVSLDKKHFGFWVSEAYFLKLQKTKSTKASEDEAWFFRVDDGQKIMQMTSHEGWKDTRILMSTLNEGYFTSLDSTIKSKKVRIVNGGLYLDEKKHIKVSSLGVEGLINSAFVSGSYTLNDQSVEFTEDGKLTGLDSISSYELNMDYNDAGMQDDKIYFLYAGEKYPRAYIYEFVSDTLYIYNIHCDVYREDSDYCNVIRKGQVKFKLIKDVL